MHIIIDGYNLIRQSDLLRRFEKISLESGRGELIRRLSLYKKSRKHRITVVFDGWESGSPVEERERCGGITILFSRKGEKADEVIKRLASSCEEQTIVVTSDREISQFVKRFKVSAVPVPVFESRLLDAASPHSAPDREESFENHEQTRSGTKKKGPSKRISRRGKTALATIKKL